MPEVLVVGGEESGKSILIRRIKEILNANDAWNPDESSEATLPTVGVELHTISLSATTFVDIREMGSALSSRWENYLPDCSHIMFLIDTSDFGSLTSSMVLLHELLANDALLLGKPILIALNKVDLVDAQTLVMVNNFLRVEELKKAEMVTIIGGSCLDGSLCYSAIDWLRKNVQL